MKRFFIAILFVIFGVHFAYADASVAPETMAYQQGRYSDAKALYQTVLEQHPHSADAMYNIGNCYFKLGEWGEALTYYSRARRLAPRNEDIAFNTRMLESQLKTSGSLSPFSVEFAEKSMRWISVDEAAIVFFLHLAIFLFFVLGMVLYKKPVSEFRGRLWFFGGAVLIFGALFFVKCLGDVWPNYAIIIDRKTEIKSGPSSQLTTQGFVYEGTKMRVIKTEGVWATVVLPNGVQGWIVRAAFWEL
jgi:tetratricopeptide (TPR) repeat protein